MSYFQRFKKLGINVPRLYLPASDIDLEKFSVIACDQFGAQPEYWDETRRIVGNNASSLNLILPEVYLGADNKPSVSEIHKNMDLYLSNETLIDAGEAMVFVNRQTTSGIRRGLVVVVDLECYDYSDSSNSLIRPTEGTIVERLPARVEIRRKASLEIPHTLVLIDDAQNLLMGMLDAVSAELDFLYDFSLMQNGGQICGRRVCKDEHMLCIADVLEQLMRNGKGMLFAIGDGNHSLAAAKQYWDEIKLSLDLPADSVHPARYSMVELVNLHDPALFFEPIHRLVCNADADIFWQQIGLDADLALPVETVQPLLDEWLKKNPNSYLDYIHGEEECRLLAQQNGCVPIIFSDFEKHSFFDRIRNNGTVPRKSFSIGRARDKRYYLECRRITI
jgi:hypothetical protein